MAFDCQNIIYPWLDKSQAAIPVWVNNLFNEKYTLQQDTVQEKNFQSYNKTTFSFETETYSKNGHFYFELSD